MTPLRAITSPLFDSGNQPDAVERLAHRLTHVAIRAAYGANGNFGGASPLSAELDDGPAWDMDHELEHNAMQVAAQAGASPVMSHGNSGAGSWNERHGLAHRAYAAVVQSQTS